VAATVASGEFHQPVLVPGTRQVRAARPVAPRTAAGLRLMMRRVVTTGTAQVDGQGDNSWLIAYRGDLAVACLVEDGGLSGPVVRRFLSTVS
jgi:cell division protein FtsI/penicillin-binding protein 2